MNLSINSKDRNLQNHLEPKDWNKLIKNKDLILTQSKKVSEFEQKWSKWLGVKYSVFVNSGSSANFLSTM